MPVTRPTPAQVAILLAAKIAAQVNRGAGKGLNAARVFLASRWKEALSVPVPNRKRGKDRFGNIYYYTSTPAIKGAAPRKLSGKFRMSVWSKMVSPRKAVIGANARGMPTRKRPTGFNYPAYHELKKGGRSGQHPSLQPTVQKYKRELKRIVGQWVKLEVG